jgi:photosystem II stability/assembly factor-like uncharacterized protein
MVIPVRRFFLPLALLVSSNSVFAGENVWTANGPPGSITALAMDPEGSVLFAAATSDARSVAYRSLDHGSSWTPVGEAPMNSFVSAIAAEASHADTVYAATATSLGASPSGAVYGSLDAGSSWSLLAGLDGFLTGAMSSGSADPPALYAAGSVCRCLRYPCLAGMSCIPTVLRSHDFGRTWASSNQGLSGWQLTSIAVDSFDPNRLLSGGDVGAFSSEDGGDRWSAVNVGLEGCPWVTSLAAAGSAKVFYAAAARYGGETLECGGVFRTVDGGRSWSPTSLRNVFATSIAIDPSRPEIVYVGVRKPGPLYPDGGVFRSSDGGETWEWIGVGLPQSGVLRIVIEPSGRVIHAGTLSGVYDFEIVPGTRPPVVPPRNHETRTVPPRQ